MSSSKNLLLLTPQLPYPPHSGASLRNFHILQGVSQQHQVSLISFGEGDAGISTILTDLCQSVTIIPPPAHTTTHRLTQLLQSRQPDMAHRLTTPLFDQKLRQVLLTTPYDLVQIEGLELAHAIPLIRQISPKSRILLDNHNAETALQQRTFLTDLRQPRQWLGAGYSWLQSRRLARYEAWALEQVDLVTAVSEADKVALQSLAPDKAIRVIPNCIDVDQYQGLSAGNTPHFDLLFMGKMDYRPNVDAMLWFTSEIWDKILATRPETSLGIVGQKPHRRLAHLQALPNVTMTGWVEQVEPYLAGSTVVIMPFRIGSGTRLKLLQAMSAGKPVVSTPIGAEGYPVAHNQELVFATTPSEFAFAILTLLTQPHRQKAIGESAQQFAQQYDWRQIIPQMVALWSS